MQINFFATTNHPYVRVNTVRFTLKNGSTLTIDRDSTEYTINDGVLSMVWNGCYLWALDDKNIFGDNGYHITDQYAVEELYKLLDDATMELELEDDADEDYFVNVTSWWFA